MIFIIKVVNEYGEEKGIFSVTTSVVKLVRNVRKYMNKVRIEFGSNYKLNDFLPEYNSGPYIAKLNAIDKLNKALEGCNTKGTDGLDDYTLSIERWESGEIDSSWL